MSPSNRLSMDLEAMKEQRHCGPDAQVIAHDLERLYKSKGIRMKLGRSQVKISKHSDLKPREGKSESYLLENIFIHGKLIATKPGAYPLVTNGKLNAQFLGLLGPLSSTSRKAPAREST